MSQFLVEKGISIFSYWLHYPLKHFWNFRKDSKIKPLEKHENLMLNIGSLSCGARVIMCKTDSKWVFFFILKRGSWSMIHAAWNWPPHSAKPVFRYHSLYVQILEKRWPSHAASTEPGVWLVGVRFEREQRLNLKIKTDAYGSRNGFTTKRTLCSKWHW